MIILVVISGINTANAAAACKGKFMNPITDICWSCVFPLKIGGVTIMSQNQEDWNSGVNNALCACSTPPKVGISVSFWEPSRLIEAVRTPYCFPSLGGISLDPGINAPAHTQPQHTDDVSSNNSFYQVHWYVSPLLFWLEVLLDNSCLEQNVFDLGYFTEIDPLWSDSELTFILNPDAVLFANPVAQGACAADCAAATSGFANNLLYWCGGCQGSMYPLNGWVGTHGGGVQASSLLVQRITNKMHREMLIWSASGESGQCGYYPQPLMDKRNYKMQMVYPTPNTKKINGKCCQPMGRTSVDWGSGKEYPYEGEDFAYMLFRKRDCCQGASK